MHAKPVAGDEPGDPVRYVVQVHALMSQAEIELWENLADRCRLEVDDAVHVAWLFGLKHQLVRAGDDVGAHSATPALTPRQADNYRVTMSAIWTL